MPTWQKQLERPEPHDHLVQFYQADKQALVANVGRYLWEGLLRGEGLLVVTSEQDAAAIRNDLENRGADVEGAVRHGHMAFFDNRKTLSQFMVSGQPHWRRFEDTVSSTMRQIRPHADSCGLRAYGDMVGVLWQNRQFAAALQLEQYWSQLMAQSTLSLFCGYAIDVFGKDMECSSLDALLSAHTHLMPATSGNLELAITRAMGELLGPSAHDLELTIKADVRPSWAIMPFGEAMALWLRKNLPRQADGIMASTRRHYDQLRRTGPLAIQ